MTANYEFTPNTFAPFTGIYLGPNYNLANKTIAIPHSTLSEQLLAISRNNATSLRLWKRKADALPFQYDGTLGTDYFSRSTSVGVTSASEYNSICFVSGSSLADDLIVLSQSSATASNNRLNILRRVSDSDPFPGAATIDGIDRWQTSNTNIGGTVNMRDICYIPHSTTPANDLVAISYTSSNFQLIRKTSGAPFPGATTADNVDRWTRARATYMGATNSPIGMGFIKHPTDTSKDLLVIADATANIVTNGLPYVHLIERGASDSDPFPGTTRYTLTPSEFTSLGTINFSSPFAIYSPESALSDLLCISSNNAGLILAIPRQSLDNSLAFNTDYVVPFNTRVGARSIASFVSFDRANDFFFVNRGDSSHESRYTWQVDFQPVSSPIYINTAYEAAPIEVNISGVVLNSSQAIYTFDRYVSGLDKFWNRDYWTRTTETDFILDTDFDFVSSSALTGNYTLEITGTVTLGSRTTYDETITLTSAATLVINQNVELTSAFVLSAGTTVNKTGAGPYVLTIPYADPGLVLGSGVTLAAPQPPVTVTAVDAAQSPIAGAAVYLETSPGAVVVLNGVTDSSGEITTSFSGSTPQAVVGWVRSGSEAIAYIDFPLGGNITSSGYNQTAILQQES